jgi:hypothetical protein
LTSGRFIPASVIQKGWKKGSSKKTMEIWVDEIIYPGFLILPSNLRGYIIHIRFHTLYTFHTLYIYTIYTHNPNSTILLVRRDANANGLEQPWDGTGYLL